MADSCMMPSYVQQVIGLLLAGHMTNVGTLLLLFMQSSYTLACWNILE